jgi:hypothetical protein
MFLAQTAWYHFACGEITCIKGIKTYNCRIKSGTIINTVKARSFQVGKRHFCIKIAVFRISIGSLFDIKKTYLSLAF